MITFESCGIDIRVREVKPQVARFRQSPKPNHYVFICIGTDYGYVHTSGGDIRVWQSYSGARRFLNRYLKEREV